MVWTSQDVKLLVKIGNQKTELAANVPFDNPEVPRAFERKARALARAGVTEATFIVYGDDEADSIYGTLGKNGKIEFAEAYKCADCGFTANEAVFPYAEDLDERLDVGGTVTKSECPCCGALAYPVDDEPPALTQDLGQGGADFTLAKGHKHCWITVGGLSVKVARRGRGVAVEVFRKGKEMDAPVVSAST